MIFKKKILLLSIFFIIIIQTLLYINNDQKTSFKYLKWISQDVSIGKIISISFFSGLLISSLINSAITSNKKITYENLEEKYESFNDEDEIKSNFEIPPERDIRDAQPTISVNYRVVKNTEENNFKSDKNYSNNTGNIDDWDNDDNDW